MLFNTIILSK